MDPYLEGVRWKDFHSRFINAWCEAIAARLPDHYEATIDERVVVDNLADERPLKEFEPDVVVFRGESDVPPPARGRRGRRPRARHDPAHHPRRAAPDLY
jgi:hypothetical protein